MLLQLRNLTRGWIAYVLLFLLAIAFAIWGINDVFSGVGAQNIAEVRGRSITPAQLSREMELYLRGLRNEGQSVTRTEAVERGLHMQLLESLITNAAILSYAENINVSASDRQLAARIRELPGAMNPLTSRFDEAAYVGFLREMGYSQAEFETEMRGGLTASMLMEALVAGARAPSSYGAILLAYQSERRTVSLAEAPASLVGRIPAPTEAQVQTAYEENTANLTIPEYRTLTLVGARVADFVERVNVPEARLQEEFENRRASMTQPETRTFVRLAAQNEAQARDAVARLGRGETPEAVSQALSIALTRGENQTREQIVDSAVGEAVFAMAANAPARTVQSQLAPWTVVKLVAIRPAVAPSFAQARDQLRIEIATDEANDLLQAAIATFEEARASGTSVAEAARSAGLPTTTIAAIDAQGRNPQGQAFEGLPEDMIDVAFETAEGETTDFLPVGDADVVLAVDRVQPSSVRPLEEVRPQLIEFYTGRERARRLRELAAEVTAEVAGGGNFLTVARQRRMIVRAQSQQIDRQTAAQLPVRQLAAAMFAQPEGSVVSSVSPDASVVFLAHIEAVTRTDPATAPELVEAGRMQMQQAIGQSLGETVQAEIVARANPRRNNRLIEQIFNPQQEADDNTAPATQ